LLKASRILQSNGPENHQSDRKPNPRTFGCLPPKAPLFPYHRSDLLLTRPRAPTGQRTSDQRAIYGFPVLDRPVAQRRVTEIALCCVKSPATNHIGNDRCPGPTGRTEKVAKWFGQGLSHAKQARLAGGLSASCKPFR
jgi:hypothetical protein